MTTAYRFVKNIIRKFRKSPVRNISALNFSLFQSEKTKQMSLEQMENLINRAHTALEKEENKKIAKATPNPPLKGRFYYLMHPEEKVD